MFFKSILATFLIVGQAKSQLAQVEVRNGRDVRIEVRTPVSPDAGFTLDPEEVYIFYVLDDYANQFWTVPTTCQETNCSYPVTKVSVTLNVESEDGVFDRYGVSVIEGYNAPVRIEPSEDSGCPVSSCEIDLVEDCPAEYQIFEDDVVVACAADPELFQELCPTTVVLPTDDYLNCNSLQYVITLGG